MPSPGSRPAAPPSSGPGATGPSCSDGPRDGSRRTATSIDRPGPMLHRRTGRRCSRPRSAPANRRPGRCRGAVAVVGFLVGIGASLARAIVELGASALVTPGRGIGTADEPGGRWGPIAIEAADRVPLRGWWLGPGPTATAVPSRVALVLHGLAEASPAMLGRAELLRAGGWSVLLPDSRGCGRSGGSFVTYGAGEAGDVRAWLDAIGPAGPGAGRSRSPAGGGRWARRSRFGPRRRTGGSRPWCSRHRTPTCGGPSPPGSAGCRSRARRARRAADREGLTTGRGPAPEAEAGRSRRLRRGRRC